MTNDKAAGRYFLQPIEGVGFPAAFCNSLQERKTRPLGAQILHF